MKSLIKTRSKTMSHIEFRVPNRPRTSQILSIRKRIYSELHGAHGVGFLIVYLAGTFFLTHVSVSSSLMEYRNCPTAVAPVDKIFHFGSYMVLSFMTLFAFTPQPSKTSKSLTRHASARRLMLLCFFLVAWGVFDECTQPYFNRTFEVLDLIANCFGIAVGQVLFVVLEATGIRRKLLSMK